MPAEPAANPGRVALHAGFARLVGNSPALLDTLARANLVAPTPWPVLITGETGTGKTALAEAIHQACGRGHEFVAINCAALPPTLLESQLFGYQKGAFTGADRDTPGLFETANGGTLFLDEIGDMALDAQAKVLRAIEQGLVRRLGSERETRVDVRIIGATHQPLTELIARGAFREDLYYRINSFVLDLPPLRERGADVRLLATQFLAAMEPGRTRRLADDAVAALEAHDWPGNLRELQSVLRSAVIVSRDEPVIRAANLPRLSGDEDDDDDGSNLPADDAAAATATAHATRTRVATGGVSIVELLRQVLASAGSEPDAWARFLVAYADAHGSPMINRRTITSLLRKVRGPEPSETTLQLEWKRQMRGPLVATGLVTDTGRRLSINLPACHRLLATPAQGEPGTEVPGVVTAPRLTTPSPVSAPQPIQTPGTSVPGSPTAIESPGNLPARDIRLIGRDTALDQLVRLLRDGQPLITVLGTGGLGKTQLALRAGQTVRTDYPGGCWFVDLTTARDADAIVERVAQAIGLPSSGAALADQVTAALATRAGAQLLILDNFEQIVQHAPATVGRWLREAPGAQLLVTSRTILGLTREVRFELSPLSLPGSGDATASHAVQLFVERAQQVRPDFRLGADNIATVTTICAGLSGLPLAIELAAARLRALKVADLAGMLADKFNLLRASRRDIPQHQRTLRDTLDWSFDLLDAHEQATFMRLCIFRGGFTLDAAAAVLEADTASVLDVLESLLDKSILRPSDAGDGRTARFDCYEVIREYGLERLRARNDADANELSRRHAAWFAGVGDGLRRLARSNQVLDPTLSTLGVERENFAAAVEWCLGAHEATLAARCVLGVTEHAIWSGLLGQSEAWLERTMELCTPDTDALLWVLLAHNRTRCAGMAGGSMADLAGRLTRAVELADARCADEATRTPEWEHALAMGLFIRARVADYSPGLYEPAVARDDCLRAEALCRKLHHDETLTSVLCLWRHRRADDPDPFPEAEALAKRIGHPRLLAFVAGNRGLKLAAEGRLADADRYIERAVRTLHAGVDKAALRHWVHQYATVQLRAGKAAAAMELAREAETLARELGLIDRVAFAIGVRASALEQLRRVDEAIACQQEVRRIGETHRHEHLVTAADEALERLRAQ